MMLGMSQEKLGDALGLTFQQVQKYEKGINRIGASRLQHISYILQVPVAFLFEGAPRSPKQQWPGPTGSVTGVRCCARWLLILRGTQRRDQVDAAVVQDVRRQRGAAPASCARLQPRQLPAHAGDARANQGLVADELEREGDQDRREGRQPRPLCCLPDGRGRHPTANIPGDIAAHYGTAAAATSAGVRCSMGMRSRATDRRSASECQGKWQIKPSNATRTAWNAGSRPHLASGVSTSSENAYHSHQFGVHPGNPGLDVHAIALVAQARD